VTGRSAVALLDGKVGGWHTRHTSARDADLAAPLIVCLHGGGCTSKYFDLEGVSFVERAAGQGFEVLNLDRPGHGLSPRLSSGPELLIRNARILSDAIAEGITMLGASDVVLVANSIGGAIAICLAAANPPWLRGVAVASVGIRPRTTLARLVKPLRRLVYAFEVPAFAQKRAFFGPQGSYDPHVAALSSGELRAPAVLDELQEIAFWWPKNNADIAADVRVPVDAALGEFDSLWNSGVVDTDDFGRLFTASPRVRSRRIEGVGHCVDLHHAGAELHQRQLDFARQCMPERTR
jgi:pimeloyl-ACP methyl ester carboxylesterase